MTTKQKKEAITSALSYMIKEGMVIKVRGGYRLKTKAELKKEMEDLVNEN